jgi:hypothetical protein
VAPCPLSPPLPICTLLKVVGHLVMIKKLIKYEPKNFIFVAFLNLVWKMEDPDLEPDTDQKINVLIRIQIHICKFD